MEASNIWASSSGMGDSGLGFEEFELEGPSRRLLASRVAGVGVGVFLFFFFLALSIVICAVGSRMKRRWLAYIGSSVMFGIVALVLLASPKGDKPKKPPHGYDQTVIPLVIIAIILVLGILVGAVGMLVFQVIPPTYARPLSQQVDVERKYKY